MGRYPDFPDKKKYMKFCQSICGYFVITFVSIDHAQESSSILSTLKNTFLEYILHRSELISSGLISWFWISEKTSKVMLANFQLLSGFRVWRKDPSHPIRHYQNRLAEKVFPFMYFLFMVLRAPGDYTIQ